MKSRYMRLQKGPHIWATDKRSFRLYGKSLAGYVLIWALEYSLVVPMRKIYRYFYGFVAAEGVKGNVGRGFYREIGAAGRTWRRPGVALYRRFQVFEFELGASGRRKHVGCKILGFLPPPPLLCLHFHATSLTNLSYFICFLGCVCVNSPPRGSQDTGSYNFVFTF